MQNVQRIILLLTTTCPFAGCATLWPPKPVAEDVAEQQKERKVEMIKSFEEKRDAAQFEAALVRWREGDIQGCQELVDSLLARNSRHRGGRLLRAEFRLVEERPELAITDIEALVAEDSNDAESAHLLGLLLEAAGRQNEAIVHFEHAAQLSPENEVFATSYHTALIGEPALKGQPSMAAGKPSSY